MELSRRDIGVRNRSVARKTNSPYVPVGVGFISADPSPHLLAALEKERKLQIAERIKELRENSPYTQEAIADRLGVTVRAYQKQEKTGGVSYDNIEKLAELHGVEADWILKGDKTATPDLLNVNGASQLDRLEAQVADLTATIGELVSRLDAQRAGRAATRAAEASKRKPAGSPRKPRTTPKKRQAG